MCPAAGTVGICSQFSPPFEPGLEMERLQKDAHAMVAHVEVLAGGSTETSFEQLSAKTKALSDAIQKTVSGAPKRLSIDCVDSAPICENIPNSP
jgi:hypothetical protein